MPAILERRPLVEYREGPEGERGPRGRDGERGPPGRDGERGPAGRDGKDGRDGLDGEDGQPHPLVDWKFKVKRFVGNKRIESVLMRSELGEEVLAKPSYDSEGFIAELSLKRLTEGNA